MIFFNPGVQHGVHNKRMLFPESDAELRTDVTFDEMNDEEHHKGPSPLSQINRYTHGDPSSTVLYASCVSGCNEETSVSLGKRPLEVSSSPSGKVVFKWCPSISWQLYHQRICKKAAWGGYH